MTRCTSGPVVRVRDEHRQAVAGEPVTVEVLLHRERRAQQPDSASGRGRGRRRPWRRRGAAAGCSTASWIWSATLCMVLVHSTSRSAPAGLQPLGRRRPARRRPRSQRPGGLQLLDVGEVDRVQHAARRVQPAEPLPHQLRWRAGSTARCSPSSSRPETRSCAFAASSARGDAQCAPKEAEQGCCPVTREAASARPRG